jgi:hypothetical protein
MRFSIRKKFRVPSTLVEYLLSNFYLPQRSEKQWRILTRKGTLPTKEREKTTIHERMRKARSEYPICQTKAYEGALQLVMELQAELPNGRKWPMKILIDSGAEANLIKKGFVPSHLTSPVDRILDLVAVNG